jgi:hypothetical protein
MTGFIERLGLAQGTILQDLTPDDVAISLNYGVGFAQFVSFFRKKAGVNAAENNERSSFPGFSPDLITSARVCSMNSDSNNITGTNLGKVGCFQRFVNDYGITIFIGCGGSEYVEPSWGNNSYSKGEVARVYQKDLQIFFLPLTNTPYSRGVRMRQP